MATLQACLEEVARLGPGYILNDAGYEWTATALLHRLRDEAPVLLTTQAYLLRPRFKGTGAIYEISRKDGVISPVPLYWIEWQPVSAPQFWAKDAPLYAEVDG